MTYYHLPYYHILFWRILKLVGILWNRTSVEVVDKLSSTSVDFIRPERELENMCLWTPYKCMFSSSLSDLMMSTEVDESLSTTSTDVLFQRIPTNFKIKSTKWEIYIIFWRSSLTSLQNNSHYWLWTLHAYKYFK